MKQLLRTISVVPIVIIVFTAQLFADVKLPDILSDNMVLQRDMKVKIWGWADKDETVTVNFNNQTKSTTADADGKWMLYLNPMPAGGPYDMTVKGNNTLTIKNILMGDVWICSGQSNMRWSVMQANNAEQEIANANYPNIRIIDVESIMSGKKKDNLHGEKWSECNPDSIKKFSAVGYFFGRQLHKDLNVPIGLIGSNWGGTNVHCWMSSEKIKDFSEYDKKMQVLDTLDVDRMLANKDAFRKEWDANADNSDQGIQEKWFHLKEIDANWKKMKLPQAWENAGLEGFDGTVWFFHEFELTKKEAAKPIQLSLGWIDDTDYTYVNGIKVGQIVAKRRKLRDYMVDSSVLKPGKNIVCIRVIDHSRAGGILGKDEELYIKTLKQKISLADEWHYKIGNKMVAEKNIGPNTYPTMLYNSMINPLINFAIKGVIWYQGEANVNHAYQYRALFPAMIKDWRNKWQQGTFPFLFVQLANFKQADAQPKDSRWAELREAQHMALKLPNTAEAVIIDIGDANSIHPTNKQDVGYRLALAAKKIAYNQDIVYSGPVFKSMKIKGNNVYLKFDHIGSGLCVKDPYGYLKGFTIAGADSQFVWAKAFIEGDEVVVTTDKVQKPVAVRYAWANNPYDANLYNKEGLPACPFRTDDFPGITFNPKYK